MREREAELDRRGVRIFAVTFEPVTRMREYQEKERLPFPILRDPRRDGYKCFGIERKNARTIWSPGTVWYYIKRAFQGRLPEKVKADLYQLGGDVLLDADGSVLWVYRSQNPADRPSVDEILKHIIP